MRSFVACCAIFGLGLTASVASAADITMTTGYMSVDRESVGRLQIDHFPKVKEGQLTPACDVKVFLLDERGNVLTETVVTTEAHVANYIDLAFSELPDGAEVAKVDIEFTKSKFCSTKTLAAVLEVFNPSGPSGYFTAGKHYELAVRLSNRIS